MGQSQQGSRRVEDLAEWLAADQLDLLAQVEAQLRAVHHTMRRIEQLRAPHGRATRALSAGERGNVIRSLSGEISKLNDHLVTQAECCHHMLSTIGQMQQRLIGLQHHQRADSSTTERRHAE
jgi:hypothetical protein